MRTLAWVIGVLAAYSSAAVAFDDEHQTSWYKRQAEGWFFYKDPPDDEKPKPKKKEPKPEPVVVVAPPPPAPAKPAGPVVMSTEWLRVNIPKYLDQAVDNPTPENVSAFIYLQRYAMDKSFKFMDSFEKVSMFDPIADESIRRPFATAAAERQDQEKASVRAAYMQKIIKQAGLFFFFERDSLGSDMANVLGMLQTSLGMEVIPVDVAGNSEPFSRFSDVLVDKGHNKRFQISTYPAVVMVKPNQDFFVLSQGMLSLDELLKRIAYAGVEMGLITEQELNEGRGINNVDSILAGPNLLEKGQSFEPGSMPDSKSIIQIFKEANYQ